MTDTTPYAVLDDTDSELIVVRVVGPLSDDNYQRYQDELWQAMERRRGHFALVLHQGRLRSFPSRYLRVTTTWLSAAERQFEGRWQGAAFVISNALLRGTVQVLSWASRPSISIACFGTSAEAEAWARRVVAEARG